MIRTVKEDVIWIHEFESLEEAKGRIKEFIEFYNKEYPHQLLAINLLLSVSGSG